MIADERTSKQVKEIAIKIQELADAVLEGDACLKETIGKTKYWPFYLAYNKIIAVHKDAFKEIEKLYTESGGTEETIHDIIKCLHLGDSVQYIEESAALVINSIQQATARVQGITVLSGKTQNAVLKEDNTEIYNAFRKNQNLFSKCEVRIECREGDYISKLIIAFYNESVAVLEEASMQCSQIIDQLEKEVRDRQNRLKASDAPSALKSKLDLIGNVAEIATGAVLAGGTLYKAQQAIKVAGLAASAGNVANVAGKGIGLVSKIAETLMDTELVRKSPNIEKMLKLKDDFDTMKEAPLVYLMKNSGISLTENQSEVVKHASGLVKDVVSTAVLVATLPARTPQNLIELIPKVISMADHTVELTKGIRKLIQEKELPVKTPVKVVERLAEWEKNLSDKEKKDQEEYERQNREYEIKRSKGIPVKIPTLKKGEPANIVWKSIKLANDTFEKYREYRDILLE